MRFASTQCSKTRLRPGLNPGPRWGSLQRFPDSLAGCRGPLRGREGGQEGREGQGRGGEGKGRRGERREGRGGEVDGDAQLEQAGPAPIGTVGGITQADTA